MHISVVFVSVDKYSVVVILCNYLQINNKITLFKKNIYVKIAVLNYSYDKSEDNRVLAAIQLPSYKVYKIR